MRFHRCRPTSSRPSPRFRAQRARLVTECRELQPIQLALDAPDSELPVPWITSSSLVKACSTPLDGYALYSMAERLCRGSCVDISAGRQDISIATPARSERRWDGCRVLGARSWPAESSWRHRASVQQRLCAPRFAELRLPATTTCARARSSE